MPERLVTPDMSLCIRYGDIYNGSTPAVNATIADLFNGTPETTSLMTLCIYRNLKSYEAIITNGSVKCHKEFHVHKFYNAEYVCYRFQKVVREKDGPLQRFAYQNIANSLIYQGLFYGIFIDLNALTDANLCKVAVHGQGTWPNEAISTAPYFYRMSDGVPKYNLVRAIYSTIDVERMPDPYDTQCIEYGPAGRKGCENICVHKGTIDLFDKVPFTTIEFEPLDIGHIGRDLISKKNNTNALNALEERCRKTCNRNECTSLFFTTSILKEERGDYNLFAVLVQAPITPRIKIVRHPSSQLTDFLVYVTSCFGTWFGISVMSLNPFPLLQQEQKQKKKAAKREKEECGSCDDCLISMNRMFDEIRSIKACLRADN